MVAFELDGGEAAARAVVEATRIWQLGESLGGRGEPDRAPGPDDACEPRRLTVRAAGRTSIRLSAGIESAHDLIADLDQALAGSAPGRRPADGARRQRGGLLELFGQVQ